MFLLYCLLLFQTYFSKLESPYKTMISLKSPNFYAIVPSFPISAPRAAGRAPRLEVPFAGRCWKLGSPQLSIPPCAHPCLSLPPLGPACWQPVHVSMLVCWGWADGIPHNSSYSHHAVAFSEPKTCERLWGSRALWRTAGWRAQLEMEKES
jgi:hypothetical protein